MNKEQAMSYGVREDAYRAFQDQVNRDVQKRVRELLDKRKGGETAFALKNLREAINAMLALIDDANTLEHTLTSVNRIYNEHLYRKRKASENSQPKDESTTESHGTHAETEVESAECP
jgi:hypothetical protein